MPQEIQNKAEYIVIFISEFARRFGLSAVQAHLRTIVLAIITVIAYSTNATAQVETTITQDLTINGGAWTKVLKAGDSVTIFSYKQDGDTHSFGIYSDDYAGEIDIRGIPFNVDSKQLKKLPKNSKKGLKAYTPMACAKAREKALAGKYISSPSNSLLGRDNDLYVRKNETITFLGYKAVHDISGGYYYYYAVVSKDGAGICYNYESSLGFLKLDDKVIVNNVPLPFLPSTDNQQVQIIIANEKQAIKERKAVEMRALEEKARKQREEQEVQRKALEEQEFENLKLMDPTYIEINKIKMDHAGGNEVTIKFTNCSSQIIKYVYFTGYFLNAVGDKCRDEINGSTVWKYTGVGPVSRIPNTPDKFGSYIKYFHSDPLFYSKNARKFRLSSVTIEYMNGKKTVLSGAELNDRVDYTDY